MKAAEGYAAMMRVLLQHAEGADQAAREARRIEAEARDAAEVLEAIARFERQHGPNAGRLP